MLSSRISAAVPGIEPRPASQHRDVLGILHAGAARAVHYFHRGERMDVDIGEMRLNRDQEIAILEGRHVGVDAALHADFGCSARDRIGDLRDDGVVGMVVGIGFPFLALEAAELAADETDIGEVNVAIDDVRDFLADVFGAREVGRLDDGAQIVAGRRINREALVGGEFPAVETLEQHGAHVG
jgi:hypothetical protein